MCVRSAHEALIRSVRAKPSHRDATNRAPPADFPPAVRKLRILSYKGSSDARASSGDALDEAIVSTSRQHLPHCVMRYVEDTFLSHEIPLMNARARAKFVAKFPHMRR